MSSRPSVAVRVVRAVACAALLAGALAASAADAQSTPGPGVARQAMPLADDPALEARVMKIADELRCLVCQNETIAASRSGLAVDLRKQIRIKLGEGRSERQILDFMVERYGDFVLYRPPLKASTVLLWGGPFALLAAAAAALAITIRKRGQGTSTPELTADQTRRARELLGEGAARP